MVKAKSGYLLVLPISKNTSPLIIPPKYSYKSVEYLNGKVLSCGPKVTHVNVGDEIAYNKDGGVEIEHEDQKFIVIKASHVLAVV